MKRLVQLYFNLFILHCIDAVSFVSYNASQVGLLDLVVTQPLPPQCTDFDVMCKLEATGNYIEVFLQYETRYSTCGDHGWSLEGSAGGFDAAVAFKTTPCGTRVAVKGSRRNASIEHIRRECEVLQMLSSDTEIQQMCPRCFPRHYFYSNISRACYSELIEDKGVAYLKAVKAGKPFGLPATKRLLLQGVQALRMLLRNSIEVS